MNESELCYNCLVVKVNGCNDQEMAQKESNSHSKNRGGKTQV